MTLTLPFITKARALLKTDSIKESAITIYNKGLKLYLKQTPSQPWTKKYSVTETVIDSVINIYSKDSNFIKNTQKYFRNMFEANYKLTRNCVILSCSCLNAKELLARNRRNIWKLSDCNVTRTHIHLVCFRVPLQSLNTRIKLIETIVMLFRHQHW